MTDIEDVERWLGDIEHDETVDAKDARDLRAIGEALIGIERAETALVSAVAKAKESGRSWTDIANVLGVSRQAARQRFGSLIGGNTVFLSHADEDHAAAVTLITASLNRLIGVSWVAASTQKMASELASSEFVHKRTSVDAIEAWLDALTDRDRDVIHGRVDTDPTPYAGPMGRPESSMKRRE